MLLRAADLTDLGACLALDADSQTDHVWQMDERQENGGRTVRFKTVRLPRVMYVSYPRERDGLLAAWEGGATVLVTTESPASERSDLVSGAGLLGAEPPDAEPSSADPAPVLAYCQLDACAWQGSGWISHLIVDRPHRRRGIATAMLQACKLWARKEGLQRLMVSVQTKNYPAICFCEKHGFAFCGYNDRYYENRDIALFFTLWVG
jgi:ribosomal protein S18 acetylase RimI-like enzyme